MIIGRPLAIADRHGCFADRFSKQPAYAAVAAQVKALLGRLP